MLPLLWCFFAHLLILQYPDHHQNLISSSLYYSGPLDKISFQSVYNFLSNVVHRQTDRQTDKLTNTTKNITSFAKEVKISTFLDIARLNCVRKLFHNSWVVLVNPDDSQFTIAWFEGYLCLHSYARLEKHFKWSAVLQKDSSLPLYMASDESWVHYDIF